MSRDASLDPSSPEFGRTWAMDKPEAAPATSAKGYFMTNGKWVIPPIELPEDRHPDAPFVSMWPRPNFAADIIVLRATHPYAPVRHLRGYVQVLLIKRLVEPFVGMWALPGGFVHPDESAEEGAARELREETGVVVAPDKLVPLGVASKPGRDPRGWTVAATYRAWVEWRVEAVAGDDAGEVRWVLLSELPDVLAFDHREIIDKATKGMT